MAMLIRKRSANTEASDRQTVTVRGSAAGFVQEIVPARTD